MRGKLMSGREAQAMGLINHAVPAEQVVEAAMEIARELNALPPLAVRWTKLSVNKWIKQQLNLILDASIAYEMLSINSAIITRRQGIPREARAVVQGHLRGAMAENAQATDWNAQTDDEFRRTAREFFETHVPQHLRHLSRRPRWAEVREWYLTMSRHGWLVPAWPKEWGGMGLSQSKVLVYLEELERSGAPRVMDQGLMNIGPLLIARGTDEQRRRFLPKILSGEHTWCQGYSEPNAGSDLAPACAPRRASRATSSSSTAPRSGPAWPSMPPTCSRWCAPTRRSRSRPASAS